MGLWSGASAWHLHTDLSVTGFFVPTGLLQFSEMSSSHESMAPALARSWEQRCHISSFHFVHPRCCPLSVLSHTCPSQCTTWTGGLQLFRSRGELRIAEV